MCIRDRRLSLEADTGGHWMPIDTADSTLALKVGGPAAALELRLGGPRVRVLVPRLVPLRRLVASLVAASRCHAVAAQALHESLGRGDCGVRAELLRLCVGQGVFELFEHLCTGHAWRLVPRTLR
eukprot:TRINITY_DN18278_c0_g1_i1.p2 TRINITY_DN18278_c0_g1~~TRINITY_DN18278_c0_g1_i1.p2  ORF type:complete len:125 (+),score=8.98 TRINITY_DN18278_c0_g1_i1:118-492(+)